MSAMKLAHNNEAFRERHFAPVAVKSSIPWNWDDEDADWRFPTHCDLADQYAVRVGGQGGHIIGQELGLSRYGADLLCELLQDAREAGREETSDD